MPFTLRLSGVSRKTVFASVRRDESRVIIPGVYIATRAWPDEQVSDHLLTALAHQLRSPGIVGSHHSAALGHGIPVLEVASSAGSPPRFTRAPAPGVRSRTRPRTTVRALPLESVSELAEGVLAGMRITTPGRTALDLAVEADLPSALMATDHVARNALIGFRGQRVPIADLGVDLTRAAQPTPGKTPGWTDDSLSAVARHAALLPLRNAVVAAVHRRSHVQLVLDLTDPLRESPAESYSFGWFVLAGLPLPRCQVQIDLDGSVARVDFYWDEYRLVGECDGAVKYRGPDSDHVMVKQNLREQALRDRGFGVVRWTAAEVFSRPASVMDRVAARLAAGGWRGERIYRK